MITNWIVLKSTQKGLLKNVQDGTSRCFGGREFNKTKVETILWDTMYDQAQNGKIVAEDRKTNRKTGTLGHA